MFSTMSKQTQKVHRQTQFGSEWLTHITKMEDPKQHIAGLRAILGLLLEHRNDL